MTSEDISRKKIITKDYIIQNYTREEFCKKLESEKYGQAAVDGLVCPSSIGLKDPKECESKGIDCKSCWLKAIKKLGFSRMQNTPDT